MKQPITPFHQWRGMRSSRVIFYGCWVSLCLVFSISLPTVSIAQTKIWDKTLGGNKDDQLNVMIVTPDGGYLLGGYSTSDKSGEKSEPNRGKANENGGNSTDYWVVKTDAAGQKVWDKTFGGNFGDNLTALLATPDGGYLLGGYSQSDKSGDKSEGRRDSDLDSSGDFWVIKIDGSGKKIWDKTFGGNNSDELATLATTPDGGYLLGGSSSSGKSGDKSTATEGSWLLKIDAAGKKVWDKNYPYLNGIRAIKNLLGGGYVLGGTGFASNGDAGYTIGKLDASGNTLWNKTYGGNNNDSLYEVLLTEDGGYLLGGFSDSGKNGDKSTSYVGYWVVKLNANGEKVWDKSYGGSSYDVFRDMVAAPDGGYLLGGTSIRGKGGDKTEDKRGYWVIKITKNGTKVWEKTFGGSTSFFTMTSLVATADNNFLLGGYSSSNIDGDKSEPNRNEDVYFLNDYWIVKVSDTNKKSQTITFDKSLVTKTLGDAPFTLSAQASSGLPVTFSLVSGPATLKNNTITLTGTGKVIVKASQAGNATYSAAPEATQTIVVDNPSPVTKIWDKTYGDIYDDWLTDLLNTPDGGHLLAGTSRLSLDFEPGFAIIKINKNGEQEWRKDLGGDSNDRLFKGVVAADGGYLFGGSTNLQDLDDDSYEFWVVKTTNDGTKQWEKKFLGPGILKDLIATPDGGYLLGGNTNEIKGKDKSEASRGKTDYWVVKIDGAGNKLWDKTLGGTDIEELASLIATPDGGYLVGGSSYSGQGGDKSEKGTIGESGYPTADYWVVKIDAQGKKLWDKTFRGNEDDNLRALVPAVGGGYLLAGTSLSGKGADKSEPQKSGCTDPEYGGCADYWVVRIDNQGTKLWDKTLGTANREDLARVLATPDGGYLLAGSSTADINGDKSQFKRGGSDYWVLKINSTGAKVWDKTLGGNRGDRLAGLVATADGHYLLGGTSVSEANGDKEAPRLDKHPSQVGDIWLVKIKEEAAPEKLAWDMRYGGSGIDNLTDVIKTSDGGYLSAGYTDSGVSGDKTQSSRGKNDYWIVKSDQKGKKLWDKRYGGSENDYLNRVIQTQDGGYLLAGSSFSGISGDKTEETRGSTPFNFGSRDYWVVKVDAQGTKQWDKRFGGSLADELRKVVQLSSGEYVLGGHSDSPADGDKSQDKQGTFQNTDYWLVKISATGSKIWDRRYGGINDETLGGFTVTPEGGFLLAGTSASGTSGDKSQAKRGLTDIWVVRTDNQGNILWEKAYGGSKVEEAYSVVPGQENTFFISGTSTSQANGDKSQPSRGGRDYWVLKIDGTGKQIWDETLGTAAEDFLEASAATQEGGLVLAGTSLSDVSGEKSQNSQGSYDYWVVQLDAEGKKVRDLTLGGSGRELARTITQTQDGGLLLGGRSESGVSGDRTQPSQGGLDYWLVKLAPATTALVAERTATLVQAPAAELNLLTAYPNPSHGQVTVRFTLLQPQTATVKVYDNQGREVTTLFQEEAKANETYEVEWQAGSKPAGLYFLQLQTSTIRQQHKLLLTK